MNSNPIITREIAPIPKRELDAHKGQVGRLVIVGGCKGTTTMVGAPALAARAAFRCGAGLVQIMVPAQLQIAVTTIEPCATACALPLPGSNTTLTSVVNEYKADVLAIGPGLGDSVSPSGLRELLTHYKAPIVADADALNLLSTMKRFEIPNPSRIVLTPHPGEMQRILHNWGGDVANADRMTQTCALSNAIGCTVVLKGRGTIVACDGRAYINETGNAGMATAGSGDVLTGIIAALIGQRMEPCEAAILGVYLHGLAGDYATQEMGQLSVTAYDIIEALPEAIIEHSA